MRCIETAALAVGAVGREVAVLAAAELGAEAGGRTALRVGALSRWLTVRAAAVSGAGGGQYGAVLSHHQVPGKVPSDVIVVSTNVRSQLVTCRWRTTSKPELTRTCE